MKRYRLFKFNTDHEADGRFGGPGTSHQPTGNPVGRPGGVTAAVTGAPPSTGAKVGAAGVTALSGVLGTLGGDFGGAVLGRAAGAAIGSAIGPEGTILGGIVGDKVGQFAGAMLGGMAGDQVGAKIGTKLMGIKEQEDGHGIGLGASIGAEAAGWGALAATRFLPGGNAIRPLFDLLPDASKVGAKGVLAARATQGAVEGAGGLAGALVAGGGDKKIHPGIKAGAKAARLAAGSLKKGLPLPTGGRGGSTKHFLNQTPPSKYQSTGSMTSMYRQALPNLFGPRAWKEVSGTKFGGYIRQRVKEIAEKLDDVAEGNNIDLKPADPAAVQAANQSVEMQGQQQDQQAQGHELDMAAASAPQHTHQHVPGEGAPLPASMQPNGGQPPGKPGAGGGSDKAKGAFGKARDVSQEKRDRNGKWTKTQRYAVDTARNALAGGGALTLAGAAGRAAWRVARRAKDKEETRRSYEDNVSARYRARDFNYQEKVQDHLEEAQHHYEEARTARVQLASLGDPQAEDAPHLQMRRNVLSDVIAASEKQQRFHEARAATVSGARRRSQTRGAHAMEDAPPGSKIYTAGRMVRRLFKNPGQTTARIARYTARLLHKEQGTFAMPNDAISRNAMLTGGPSNTDFLARMQASDQKSRLLQLTRAYAQPGVASLQRGPAEREKAYDQRMFDVMGASVTNSNKLRPQPSQSGLGLSAHIPDQVTRYTVKTKKGRDWGDAFAIHADIEKGLDTEDTLKQGLVYGWASIISKDGEEITDHQGDRITEEELTKAAHDFICNSRQGGVLHDEFGHKIGHIVESMVFSKQLQKSLGVDLKKTGWLICYQITDPRVKTLVKAGVLKSFSIGGKGQRVPAHG